MERRKTEEPGEIVMTKKNEEIIRRHGNMSEESEKCWHEYHPILPSPCPPEM